MSLVELNIYFPNQHQFVVKFANTESEVLAFQSPVIQKDLKNYLARLRWYIEVYAELYTGEPDDDEAQRHLNFSILRVMN